MLFIHVCVPLWAPEAGLLRASGVRTSLCPGQAEGVGCASVRVRSAAADEPRAPAALASLQRVKLVKCLLWAMPERAQQVGLRPLQLPSCCD